jgi:polyphosphate kinase 2 (PPK2 family)
LRRPSRWKTFLQQTPNLERAIIDSGIILIKYWLDVSMENQAKRFCGTQTRIRAKSGSSARWTSRPSAAGTITRARARDAMFRMTDTDESPWYVVDANDQRRARLNCIAHFLSLIPYEEVPHKTGQDRQAPGERQL